MHAFFQVLASSLRNRPLPPAASEGSILFRVMGLSGETFRVELRHRGCATSSDEAPASLTVWTSRSALDKMLRGDGPSEPLRIEGERHLLDSLAALGAPGLSPLAAQIERHK